MPVADQLTPEWIGSLPGPGNHFVYHLWGPTPGHTPEESVTSIYVGVTSNLAARLRSHSRKWWWVAVDPTLCEFEECPDREEAEEIEKQTIRRYQPAMNRAGRLLVVTTV